MPAELYQCVLVEAIPMVLHQMCTFYSVLAEPCIYSNG